jgi:hypothetical protein
VTDCDRRVSEGIQYSAADGDGPVYIVCIRKIDHSPNRSGAMTGFTDPARFPSSNPGGNPFAEQVNPYEAPREVGYQPLSAPPGFAGLWRQGNVLVMHKLAPLPNVCLKSNQPATGRLKRSLSWHHPAIYLLILLHLLIYIVVALIVRKTATIQIGLSDEWFARRRRRMLTAWALIFLSIGLFIGGAFHIDGANGEVWPALLMIFSIVLLLGAAIYGLVSCRMVWPQRMTGDYIWLKGVNAEFLNRLEPWQWNL